MCESWKPAMILIIAFVSFGMCERTRNAFTNNESTTTVAAITTTTTTATTTFTIGVNSSSFRDTDNMVEVTSFAPLPESMQLSGGAEAIYSPDFTEPIKNVTVAVGREAVLSCSVTELGNYKVGWLRANDQTVLSLHNRVITHNPRISVTHDDRLRKWQLRIRQLKESDRGCYMCQINTGNMKKQFGCIDVHVPPDINDTWTSSDVTIDEGANVTLNCRANGHPEPRIVWRREDGGHILLWGSHHTEKGGRSGRGGGEGVARVAAVETHSGPNLSLVKVERRQMGAYLCIASNEVPPAVSKRVMLSVNFVPKVEVKRSVIGAQLYTNAKLKCDVESYPHSSNYWLKDQHIIPDDAGLKYTNVEERKSDYRVLLLLIVHNISLTDFGTYSCVATNSIGSADASIRIFEIPLPTTTTTTTTTTTKALTTTIKTTPFASLSTTHSETNSVLPTPPSIVVDQSKHLVLEITNAVDSTVNLLVDKSLDGNVAHNALEPRGEPSSNWLFPSVSPASLGLEPKPKSSSSPLSVFPTGFSRTIIKLLLFVTLIMLSSLLILR